MRQQFKVILTVLVFSLGGCQTDEVLDEITENGGVSDYADWQLATHSKEVDPDYATVFNQNEVLRFDIKISAANWSAMQADLADLYGTTSGPGSGMGGSFPDENPMWAESSIVFNDTEWYHVGIRFKGNSSLQSAYRSGNNKLSFKLDFDEFEDDYPIINNQRFYGFKQLNLNNNFDDTSLIREKVGSDLFRAFGLTSAHTSFYVVYLDNGSGPKYYGVYTLIEEVDDTVIEDQFASDSGNLYKPDGDAAAFASGSFDTDEMDLKSNTEIGDYSDVEALYTIINSTERTTDNELWKSKLEAVLDVDVFLKWLAANTVIQNWDTYGLMTHNYFLYNNPDNDLLTWIPWDNNEAFQEGKMGGALSLDLNEVGSGWPLISYIIDQPAYREKYNLYIDEFTTNVFIPEELNSQYASYYALLKDFAYAETSGYSFLQSDADFDNGIENMKSHAFNRSAAVEGYLD